MDELQKAIDEHNRAVADVAATRERLRVAILHALDDGVPQSEIVRATGYTRETIRRTARERDSSV